MRINFPPLLLAFGLLSGCDSIDSVELSPKQLTLLQKNDEQGVVAHAKSHTGHIYPRARIEWSLNDPTVAQVDSRGRVTPLKSGRTVLTARCGDVSASLPVEVLLAEKLVVEPAPLLLVEGGPSVELQATVLDYLGRPLTDRSVIFRSTNKEVVSLGQNAAFPMAAGKAGIEVTVGELRQRVDVEVKKRL